MNEAQEKAAQGLALKDEEYFGIDSTRLTGLSIKLSALFPGGPKAPPGPPASFLALGAPRQAPLDRHHEVPILVGTRSSGRREWEVHLLENSVVVVADLKTGEVRTGWPFLLGKRRLKPVPSGSGAVPDETEAATVTTDVRRLDLREVFNRTWATTRIAVSVILYDWSSNVVVVDVLKEGPPPAEARPQKPSEFLAPGGAAASSGPGTSLSVPAQAAKGSPLILRGSVDLELDQAAVAPLEGSPDASLLLASVIFRKLDSEEPLQVNLAAPAKIVESKGVRRVQAPFEFDVRAALKGRELQGSYQVYLAAGATLAGPYPLTVAAP